MTCREIADFVIDYVTGELSEATRAAFEKHLGGCTACRNYLDSYRKTIAVARAAVVEPEAEVAAMPEGLVQAILAARRCEGDASAS